MRELPRIEFHQQDFIPGFAAFLPGATTPSPDSKAFCVLNLGAMLSTVYHGRTKREDLPYFLADSIMHEVIHVLEQWAGVEFNEERVDALIEKYRALPASNEGDDHEPG